MTPLHNREELRTNLELFETNSGNAEKQRRSVTFQPKVSIRRTLNNDQYSQEERACTWYSAAEMHGLRQDVRKAIAMISEDPLLATETDKFTFRGLETFTLEGQDMKAMYREVARRAVLEEQEFQWDQGIDDPIVLSDLYIRCTRPSVAVARERGLADSDTTTEQKTALSALPIKRSNSELYASNTINVLPRRRPSYVSSPAA